MRSTPSRTVTHWPQNISKVNMSRTWPCFVFRRPRSRSFFLLVEYEFKFTTRLLHCQISGVQSDGAVVYRKKRSSLVFLFNRAESELITSPNRVHHTHACARATFRLYRPIPSGFTAFRSIHRSYGRSVDQRLSYQRNQLTINQELASVLRSPSLSLFSAPSGNACLKAVNMMEHLSM